MESNFGVYTGEVGGKWMSFDGSVGVEINECVLWVQWGMLGAERGMRVIGGFLGYLRFALGFWGILSLNWRSCKNWVWGIRV